MKPFRCFLVPFIVIVTLISTPRQAFAQPKIPEDIYLFDGNMKPVRENATYFLSIRKLGDSVWQWDTYNFKGPIIRMETFSDHDGKTKNGPAHYYTEKGDLDSIASFRNGRKDGTFYYLELSGNAPHDSLVWKIEYTYKDDSLIKTENVTNNRIDDDSTIKESMYPGGLKKWVTYLGKNLQYPDRAMNERITGLVRALFTVDENGKIGNIYLARSVEYSIDREVQRVIRKSGNWVPGMKNGTAVKTFKLQPVNMSLQ